MRKLFVGLLVLACLSGTVSAERFQVAQTTLEIPAPEGFVLVTPEMDEVFDYSRLVDEADLLNENVAFYISAAEAPAALKGELPELKRNFTLKVNRKLKEAVVGSANFSELKKVTQREYQQIIEEIKAKDPGIYQRLNEGVQEQFALKSAIEVSQLVPFEAHYETPQALAVSMYLTIHVPREQTGEDEAETKEDISAATATVMNVGGKLLFLYCYAPQEDLEWTRTASQAWTENIIAANAAPPLVSPAAPPLESEEQKQDNQLAKWGIAGLVLLLVLALFVKKNRIQTD